MRCEEALEHLLDEERLVSADATEALAAHLDACAQCRQARQEIEGSWSLLGEWSAPEPQAGFADRVMVRVRDEAVCTAVQEALIEANGDLVDRAHRDHLEACAECQGEASAMRATWQSLGEWADVAPSPDFVRSVITRARGGEAPRQGQRVLRPWHRARAVASLAALLAVVLGVFAWLGPAHHDRGSATTVGRGSGAVAAVDSPDLTSEGDDLLEALQPPAPSGEADDAIEEVLSASFVAAR